MDAAAAPDRQLPQAQADRRRDRAAASPACLPPGSWPGPASAPPSWRPASAWGGCVGSHDGGRADPGQRRGVVRHPHLARWPTSPPSWAWPARSSRRTPAAPGSSCPTARATAQDRRARHPRRPLGPGSGRALGRRAASALPGDKVMPAGSCCAASSQRGRAGPGPDGRRVLRTVVAPVVGGVYSADPEVLEVDMVAPGLRAGCLARFAGRRGACHPQGGPGRIGRGGIAGGMGRSDRGAAGGSEDPPRFAACGHAAATAVTKHDAGWLVESAAGTSPADAVLMAADGGRRGPPAGRHGAGPAGLRTRSRGPRWRW